MDDMKKKILEAFIRDGILEDKTTHINEIQGYGWEYNSLAEAIEDNCYQDYLDESLTGDQTKQYEIGDIIFATKLYSPNSRQVVTGSKGGHKVVVITSRRDANGVVQYRGFELSSKKDKANIQGKYPNNLYIKDYSSILSKGSGAPIEAIVRVDDLVKFSSKDLSPSGSYKGKVSNEFLQFIQQGYSNYKSGHSKDNFNLVWER